MSETPTTDTTKEAPKRNLEKFNKARQRKVRPAEPDEFQAWLNGLGFQSAPKVHINGIAHALATVVVDFGTPLIEPVKLTSEQTAELISHIRAATKTLYRDREVNVRVQNDSSTGVWWSSIS